MKVVELFSGIGAQAKALERTKIKHEILATCDWDLNAIIAYDFIHNKTQKSYAKFKKMNESELDMAIKDLSLSANGKKPISLKAKKSLKLETKARLLSAIENTNNLIDVSKVSLTDSKYDEIDLLTYSFPCQDLSLAGNWHNNQGGIDKDANNRSSLLWQVERILEERQQEILDNPQAAKKMPRSLLMENVTAIRSSTHIDNFNLWTKSLESLGYVNQVFDLNASDFGVPQMRKRTYMLSIFVGTEINKNVDYEKYVLEMFSDVNEKNLHTFEKYKSKHNISIKDVLKKDYSNLRYKIEADACNPNITKSRISIFEKCDALNLIIDNKYLKPLPTVTTKQDRYPNSGLVMYDEHRNDRCPWRYLTPRECFLLMGFDEKDFKTLINNNFDGARNGEFFTRDKMYRMAGNSICVNVLESIFLFLNELLNNDSNMHA